MSIDISFTADELEQLDKVSKLPLEYPGWMLEFQGGNRGAQLAGVRHPGR